DLTIHEAPPSRYRDDRDEDVDGASLDTEAREDAPPKDPDIANKPVAPHAGGRDEIHALDPDAARTVLAPLRPAAAVEERDTGDERAALSGAAGSGAEEVVPFRWDDPAAKPLTRRMRWALGGASGVLALLLAGQALFHFRHALAARYPDLR